MATYSVNTAKTATLVAATADTVNFASDLNAVELINHGSTRISYRYDGTAPTVDGDDCYALPAGGTTVVTPTTSGNTSIGLISSGTPAYTAQSGM